ncbi:MAG: hypothetical protein QM726_15290 [Chitinophagaceae bacterium]
MIFYSQPAVNSPTMPGIKTTHPFIKNCITVLIMMACIAAAVLLAYRVQVLINGSNFQSTKPLLQTGLHKIDGITRNDVYDLSGAEAMYSNDPMNLFDENTDPANGIAGDPKTQAAPLSNTNNYYPPGRGFRIVIDLKDLYKLSDIYLYDRAFESDSVWVYTGSMSNWKLAGAFSTSKTAATWGWKNFSVDQSTRFVMIRINSYRAIITEMALYGNIQQKLPAETLTQLPALAPPTLKEFSGTNTYDYVSPDLLRSFSQVRSYMQMDYFDTDTVHAYPKNKLTLNYFKQPAQEQLRYYADSLLKYNIHYWMSIRGVPKYLEKKGIHDKDKPVTTIGMNTEDPMSYARHAKTFWNMAALFGKTKIDTNQIDVSDVPRFSGLGVMDRFENGNEEDGFWTPYYWTPVDYFAVSSADYDGHEGKLGNKCGLYTADKNSKLMMSGMIQLDTSRVRTLYFLCRQLRKDKKFIWEGGVQYHYYSNDAKDHFKPSTKGISPEEDHLREKLAKVRAFHNRLLPGIPLILGENGYDRSQQSWQKTPLLPGYSAAQSQGIMAIRSFMAAFMAGFDGYNQYMMRSATNYEDAPGPYATSGMLGGPANKIIYPLWYYWNTFIKRLGDYQPDSIIAESGNVWIYRFKHKADANRKAFVLFSPTVNGSMVKNFNFNTGDNKSQYFTYVKLAEENPVGLQKTIQPVNGSLQFDVGESPVILIQE